MAAETPAEILNIDADADEATLQKAWKRLVFQLHPDKLARCSARERAEAADALHAVHRAREDFRESAQASGAVEVPDQLEQAGRPTCTKNSPGQRRYECRWQVPEITDPARPIEKYEVYGPRIFSHSGEPMEWVLLATLPKLEGCFVFVEESPTQQEVMWAGDRVRAPSVPLTVYGVNGRGRSEPLYFHLPWEKKFPWLQGLPSMICRQCCTLQPRPPAARGDRAPCATCGATLSAHAAGIVVRCPKCHGETLWDAAACRLDCRLCGRHVAGNPSKWGTNGGAAMRDSRSVPPDRGDPRGERGGRSVPPDRRW